MKSFFVVVFIALLGVSCYGAQYSYVDLVGRLTDLEQLAVLPVSGEKCMQASSYDRASRYDEAAGKYINWDANGDSNGMVRVEGGSFVMADITGPGCIWRIWSAKPESGSVKIYLDGSEKPVLDMPFKDYFDNTKPPFDYPALVYCVSRGFNNYVPIPFQKSCKIVAEKGWGAYYHFTYSIFPKGTKLPTFNPNMSYEEKSALKAVNDFFSTRLGQNPKESKKAKKYSGVLSVGAGRKKTLIKLQGQQAITSIKFKLTPDKFTNEHLRNILVSIYWDGENEPSVWSPIGDFFGTAPGLNKYKSLPMGITEKGAYCYWYMPFSRQAIIEIENETKSAINLSYEITVAPLSKPIKDLGRFHAKWHRDFMLPTEPERWLDWPILKTKGRGRYVGVALEVWNPKGGWWGEGDEKFFIDGEKFPSTFGTGSEDYFGYAWCDPTLFQAAYHNQTRNDGFNKKHVSVNRWQIPDNVPFMKSIDAYIEKYFTNDYPTLYACVAYWYQEAGQKDPYKKLAWNERNNWYTMKTPFKAKGVLEGEQLKVIRVTGGEVKLQDLLVFGDYWSQGEQLWWMLAKPGDLLELELPVKKSGKYELFVQMTKAGDYGIVQYYLNGKKIAEPIDLYNQDSVIPSGLISLGQYELSAGKNKLGVEIVGSNEKAVKSYLFGLDYVKLQPVK